MRRSSYLVLGLFAGAAFFSACRDVGVAPSASPSPIELDVPKVTFEEIAATEAGISFSVTIDPTRDNLYGDGINTFVLPAGSICDPRTSTYGPAHWDAPCTPATAAIHVPVTLSELNGRLVLHFETDLRFVPTNDPAKQVVLEVDAPEITLADGSASDFTILWIPSDSDRFVDEGSADPSLATIVDFTRGKLVRRLKHFSGYYVNLGYNSQCDPNVETECQPR